MSTLDLLDDSFPHGTPDGFRNGCRTAACPAIIPCRTVHMRYVGDLTFARRFDSGMTLEEILEQDAERRKETRRADRTATREDARSAAEATRKPTRPTRQATPKPQRKPSTTPTPARETPAPSALHLIPEPTPRTTTPHAGLAWAERARTRITQYPAEIQPQLTRDLDRYQQELTQHIDELEQWRHTRKLLRSRLTAAAATLRTATIASGTGISLGGAIEQALHTATEQHRAAAAAYEAAQRPTEPAKPQLPRRTRPSAGLRQLQPHGTNACRARGCDRPECIEAGLAYHREWMAQRKEQPIPLEHHGTAYGYQLGCKDRTGCPAEISCADASLAEERRRRREAGIPAQAPRVPSGPVREHVRALMAAGMSVIGIAEAAHVSLSGVKTLLYGRSGARKGEIPREVESEKAQRLLELTATTGQLSRLA